MNFKVSQLKSLGAGEVAVDDLIYVIDSNPTDGSVKSKKVSVGDLIDSRIYGISSSQFVLITGYYANPSWILSLDWSKIINAPSFVTSLSALTDVTIATPLTGQGLVYNGTKWVNQGIGELDTLNSVTTRGNTTTNAIVIGSSTAITASPYTLQVIGGSGGSAIFSNAAKTQGLNINLTTAGETRIYGDYFGAGVDQKLILGTFANRVTQLVLQTSGNIGIGTTTDVGYKLDVNGTLRVSGDATLGSSSTTGTVEVRGSNIVAFRINDVLNNNITGISKNATSSYLFESSSANQLSYGYASNYWMSWRNSTKSIAIASTGSEPTPATTAILDLQSTTKGFLQPRMTTTQRDAIAIPATGLQVYNTTTNENNVYNGTAWVGEQSTITLTTTGTSGVATLIANVLNIPNYGSALSGYLPLTGGTLTGALSGTSATFSSSVSASSLIKSGGTSAQYLMADGSVSTLTNPITGTGTSGQVAYFNGTNSITSNNAFAFTPTTQLLINNSVTAASLIARGTNLTPTLVAAANSDVLVGLDINPTFTNGAFTGVSNLGLRVGGLAQINSGIGAVSTFAFNVSGSGGSLFTVRGYGDANLAATLWLGGYNGSNFISGGTLSIRSNQGAGNQFIVFTHNNGNSAFRILSNTNIELNPAAGNVLIGTTTDAGYKLQVNGNASIKGSGSTSATTSLLVQNSSGTNLLSVVDNGNITQTTGNATFYNGVTVQFAGIQCNNNGPINTGGNITATGTSSQIGQLQILSTGNASTSGLGISFPEATMVFQGYTLGATSVGSQFTFRNFNNTTSPLNFINSGLLRITSIGFQSGNANNLSGNTLWIEPIYNLTDAGRSGTTVRGIYYNPTLTSLVNTTHIGIQTTSGGAYINTATPAASAALQADSTTQGFLPPRLTTIQKNAITTPATGLEVYDSTTNTPNYYNGTTWVGVASNQSTGLSPGLFAQTSDSTPIVNTTVETTLISTGVGTLTVPANQFQVGASYVAYLSGVISSQNNATMEIHLRSNGSILADTNPMTFSATTAKFWEMSVNFTVRAIGGGGVAAIVTSGRFSYNKDSGNIPESVGYGNVNSTTFDTTVNNSLVITAQWGNASPLNSIQTRVFNLYRVY